MRVMVTGGSGFIGGWVARLLRLAGHDVTVVDTRPPVRELTGEVAYLERSLSDDLMPDVLDGMQAVFHLAANADVNTFKDEPASCFLNNVDSTLGLMLAASKMEKPPHVFLASTVWVYNCCGQHEVDEDSGLVPIAADHLYTASKLASEAVLGCFTNVPATVLRYGIPYGPHMRPNLVIPIFIRKALANEPITIAGDGSSGRKFIHIADMAKAHVAALECLPLLDRNVLNLDGERQISLKEIVDLLSDLLDRQLNVEYTEARQGDYVGKDVSTEQTREVLGWEPTVEFRTGLKDTVEWIQNAKK